MYRQHRAAVLGFLPPSDAVERKFFLYKTLFDGFAKIDGKLVETQASVMFSLQSDNWLKQGLFACLSVCLSSSQAQPNPSAVLLALWKMAKGSVISSQNIHQKAP